MKQTTKRLLFLFLFFFILKVLLASFILTPSIFSDEYVYAKLARNFLNSGRLVIQELPSGKAGPLYPIFISISYFFGDMGIAFFVMKIINSFLLTLSIIPIFLLAKDFLDEKKAFLATFMAMFLSPFLVFSNFVLAENLFFPLTLFSAYFIYLSFKTSKLIYYIISGLFAGLAFSAKPNAAALFPLCFVLYLISRKFKIGATENLKFVNVIIHYLFISLTIIPKLILNYSLVGFSYRIFTGQYGGPTKIVEHIFTDKLLLLINWIILYYGYIIIAAGVIFGVLFFYGFMVKGRKFRLMLLLVAFLAFFFILIAANQSAGMKIMYESPIPIFTGRPIGRYIEAVLPLVFLTGFIVYDRFNLKQNVMKKIAFVTAVILAISAQLAIAPLFPINNSSLTLLGIFKYALDHLFLNKSAMDIGFTWPSFLLIGLLLIAAPFILIRIKKKQIIPLVFLFIIVNSVLSYGTILWNVNTYWYNSDQAKLGLWIDENIGEDKIIMIDAASCREQMTKYNLNTNLCDVKQNHASLVGFLIENEIIFDDAETVKNADYIITDRELNLEKITERGNFRLYKTD